MLKELNTYDWAEVFGEGRGGNCDPIKPENFPWMRESIGLETFGREDVLSIVGMEEGENGGPDWIIYGQLKDGRWFSAGGGCDYTGWEWRASNWGEVASSRKQIERFGLTKEQRKRLGVVLPGEK